MLWGLKHVPCEKKLRARCLFSPKKTGINLFQFFNLQSIPLYRQLRVVSLKCSFLTETIFCAGPPRIRKWNSVCKHVTVKAVVLLQEYKINWQASFSYKQGRGCIDRQLPRTARSPLSTSSIIEERANYCLFCHQGQGQAVMATALGLAALPST